MIERHADVWRAIGPSTLFMLATLGLGGCSLDHYVLAATGTVIGVEVSQNPATQTPQAKIGYNRGELAFVPTNRLECKSKDDKGNVVTLANCSTGGGAKDSAEVLMEIAFDAKTDTGVGAGVYQRLAVGPTAVTQPGASFMFLRDGGGQMNIASTPVALAVARGMEVGGKERADAIIKLAEIRKAVSNSGALDTARRDKLLELAYPNDESKKLPEYKELKAATNAEQFIGLMSRTYIPAIDRLSREIPNLGS